MENIPIKKLDNQYFSDLNLNEQREILRKYRVQLNTDLYKDYLKSSTKTFIEVNSDILTKLVYIIIGLIIYSKGIGKTVGELAKDSFGIVQTVSIFTIAWLIFKFFVFYTQKIFYRYELRRLENYVQRMQDDILYSEKEVKA